MKRIFSFILVLAMIFTCCGAASATDGVADTRASLTLSGYSAILTAGTSRGVVNINYDVRASKLADSVGVKSITLYRADGSHVITINGSTSNGLIRTSSNIKKGDYSYTLTSGVSYYAEVTVFATVGSLTDSKTITTDTVKAP